MRETLGTFRADHRLQAKLATSFRAEQEQAMREGGINGKKQVAMAQLLATAHSPLRSFLITNRFPWKCWRAHVLTAKVVYQLGQWGHLSGGDLVESEGEEV